MKNKIIAAVLTAVLMFSATACGNADNEDASSASPYITENSVIEEYKQQEMADLLEMWAFAYSTHDFLTYNDCVDTKLEFADNSKFDQPITENYFDTVTNCEILNIDFANAQETDEKQYTISVEYSITYNEEFKEENGLKQGENLISSTMTIQENGAGNFFISNIENSIKE